MRTTFLSAGFVSLVTLAAACGTTNNTTVETSPNANGVFPAQGFQGNTITHVEVSGDATDWADGVTVDFGAGVTVSNVTVASPTDLFCDVTIDGAATPGQNDVTITDASGGTDGALTLTKAFEIVAPLALTFEGDVNQGGLPFFTIQDLDIAHPFDSTTGTDSQGNTIFVNETLNSPADTDLIVENVTEFSITGRAFIDATAVGGDVTLDSTSGSNTTTIDFGNVAVAARSPIALTTGSDTTGTVAEPGDTVLYSFTTPKAALLDISLSSTDMAAQLGFGFLPDGTWATAGSFPALQTASGTFDVVVGDLATEGKYDFTVNISETDLTAVAEGDDTKNNTLAATTTVVDASQGAALVVPVTLSSGSDVDFIKLTNVPAGVTIEAITDDATDQLTDTAVDIEDSTGASLNGGAEDGFTPGGDGGDICLTFGVCGEDVLTDAPTANAGTFFVQVTAGAAFADTDNAYNIIIKFN